MLLKDGPLGTDQYGSSSQTALCGKPTQDHIRKDGILWEGLHAGAWEGSDPERVVDKKATRTDSVPVPLHGSGGGGKRGRVGEGGFSLLLVLTALL